LQLAQEGTLHRLSRYWLAETVLAPSVLYAGVSFLNRHDVVDLSQNKLSVTYYVSLGRRPER
jgi:hypothetical protein